MNAAAARISSPRLTIAVEASVDSLTKRRDNTLAVMLELLPGLIFQTFGLGHLSQGRIGMGLFIMLSYWAMLAINAALTVVWIGFVTGPLTLLFYAIAAPLNAADYDGPPALTRR